MNRTLISFIAVMLILVVAFPIGLFAQGDSRTIPGIKPVLALPDLREPTLLWQDNLTSQFSGDVTDLAVGDLNNDGKDDIAAIDNLLEFTLKVFDGPGDGFQGGSELWSQPVNGYAVAVGNIDNGPLNEVVAGFDKQGILAFENDHTFKWGFETIGRVNDIELADMDGDGYKDVIACSNELFEAPNGVIYVIDGQTGESLDGWPYVIDGEELNDVAFGNLDGVGGIDVAVAGFGIGGSVYAIGNDGVRLWRNKAPSRTLEVGDVDGYAGDEVVVGTGFNLVAPGGQLEEASDGVYVFAGVDGAVLYNFYTNAPVTDVELGDLDGNPANGMEVACIDSDVNYDTLYALDIDESPISQVMWSYPMAWDSIYFGESLAIGDVDRDYLNEVVACSSLVAHKIYAFDGLDNNGDGEGDKVWMPYIISGVGDLKITDLELGDFDGDGDKDVAVGTNRYTLDKAEVVVITGPESTVQSATATGSVYLDSDPSNIVFLQAIPESAFPSANKPNYFYPHGFFAVMITGLDETEAQTCTVTVTLPSNAPIGTKWVKYNAGQWLVKDIGDDDGDNIITYEVTDGEPIADADGTVNGRILDPGAPGYPPVLRGVGGEVSGVSRTTVLAPWLVLVLLAGIGGIMMVLYRRKGS